MKKEIIYFVLISLVLLISTTSLGCNNKKANVTDSGAGYTISVNPQNVVAGGTVVVDVRVTNTYENDMSNAKAAIYNVPTGYTGIEGSGADPLGGTIISKGQEAPAIWTISTPDTTLKESFSPKVEICFDYITNYQFQSAFRQAKALAEVELSSAVSTGPIGVSAIGADSIFVKKDEQQLRSVTLDISNNANGYIKEIKSIKFTVPKASNIVSAGKIVYTTCGASASAGSTADLNMSGCANFGKKQVVSAGITTKLEMITKDSGDAAATNPVIDKLSGSMAYTYCYEIQAGTITVCPAGQVC